jgi:hypothetical protein
MLAEELKEGMGPEKFETDEDRKGSARRFKGIQILARKSMTEDIVYLKVLEENNSASPNLPPQTQIVVQPMVRVGDVWKRGGGSTWDHDEKVWAEGKPGQIQKFVP